MIKEEIEPFIILPYGNMQDIVFFIEESIRNEYHFLIDMAYRKLSNEIIKKNLIKVVNRGDEIIIFHLYPTTYREKYSDRKGQYLIVGYIIKKNCFCKKYDNLICACSLFFKAIMQCGNYGEQSLSIPSQFLFKVNLKCYNEYINKYLKKTRMQMLAIMKDKFCLFVNLDTRLKVVYDLIKKKLIFFKEYWVLVDSENIDYYRKLCKVYNITLKEYKR